MQGIAEELCKHSKDSKFAEGTEILPLTTVQLLKQDRTIQYFKRDD